MLVTIDKRGSISLPAAVRKELGLQSGSSLDLTILDGGGVALVPVMVYPTVRLATAGIDKLKEARANGSGEMPLWLLKDMDDAKTDPL